jgi:hypothetical protein
LNTTTGTNHKQTTNRKGMIPMKTRITATLGILAVTASVLVPATVHAGGPAVGGGRSLATCAVTFTHGRQTCFTPAGAVQAERSAPWAIRPDAAVNLTFGLQLSQVSTWRAPRGAAVSEIDYFYGPLRHDYGRQGARPTAIRISEYNSRANESLYRPAWTHQVCGVRVEISPAVNPAQPHPGYGPWYLIANTKHGNRSITVVANNSRPMLQTLACRLLQNS